MRENSKNNPVKPRSRPSLCRSSRRDAVDSECNLVAQSLRTFGSSENVDESPKKEGGSCRSSSAGFYPALKQSFLIAMLERKLGRPSALHFVVSGLTAVSWLALGIYEGLFVRFTNSILPLGLGAVFLYDLSYMVRARRFSSMWLRWNKPNIMLVIGLLLAGLGIGLLVGLQTALR